MFVRSASALLLGTLVLAAAGCHRAERAAERAAEAAANQARAVAVTLGERELRSALQELQNAATRAYSARLYSVANEFDADYAKLQTNRKIAGYPLRHEVSLAKEDLQVLVQILANRKTYFPPEGGWMCIFEPRHVLQLVTKDDAVTAVICLKCGDVELMMGGDSIGTRSVLPRANADLSRVVTKLLATDAASAARGNKPVPSSSTENSLPFSPR